MARGSLACFLPAIKSAMLQLGGGSRRLFHQISFCLPSSCFQRSHGGKRIRASCPLLEQQLQVSACAPHKLLSSLLAPATAAKSSDEAAIEEKEARRKPGWPPHSFCSSTFSLSMRLHARLSRQSQAPRCPSLKHRRCTSTRSQAVPGHKVQQHGEGRQSCARSPEAHCASRCHLSI